jgi:hypothetical protein
MPRQETQRIHRRPHAGPRRPARADGSDQGPHLSDAQYRDLFAKIQEGFFACEIAVVTAANHDAAELFGAADRSELLRPVSYLFSMARETARRIMLALPEWGSA